MIELRFANACFQPGRNQYRRDPHPELGKAVFLGVAVRCYGGWGRNMVKKTAMFVVCHDQQG